MRLAGLYMYRRSVSLLLFFLLLTLLPGCTLWHARNTSPAVRLPTANMSRTSVGLEVASVTLQPEHDELLAEIFQELDEQSIAPHSPCSACTKRTASRHDRREDTRVNSSFY